MALSKITKFSYTPGTPGSPGYPGVPARGAYSYVEYRDVCVFRPNNRNPTIKTTITWEDGTVETVVREAKIYSEGYVCTPTPFIVKVPATKGVKAIPEVPATPAKTIAEFDLGWTGVAHSDEMMVADGRYFFRVPRSAVGVVVGLAHRHEISGYGHIEFGFFVARGITKILESGAEVANFGERPGMLLEVRRAAGKIQYLVDDAVMREVDAPAGTMMLSASMYSGGDEIIDAEFESIASGFGHGTMRAPRGYASEFANVAFGAGEFQALVGSASAKARGEGAGAFAALRGKGGIAFAWSDGRMTPFTGQAEGLMDAPEFALGAGAFLGVTGAATGLTGGVGSGLGAISKIVGFAGAGVGGSARGRMTPFASDVFSLTPATEAFVWSAGDTATGRLTPEVEIALVMNSRAEVVGLIQASPEYLAEVLSRAEASGVFGADAEYGLLIASVGRSSALLDDLAGATLQTWAYSLDAEGTTRYEQYNFNSFAELDRKYFAARHDGLYLLEGADDAGQPVAGEIDFGELDFGTPARKALPLVYVGMASSGKTVLKVESAGQTYFYEVRDSTEGLKQHRFELGRGLRSTFYDVSLIFDGPAFDLQSISFQPVNLTRRI